MGQRGFWDNYWETTYLYPHGEWIPGACNDPGGNDGSGTTDVPLYFPSNGSNGYTTLPGGGSHSDVHLWYQGTVDTVTNPVTDGSASFDAQNDGWYGGNNPPQTTSGYYFSRVEGGDRTTAPDGLLWYDQASRTAVSLAVPTTSAWDNVEITSLQQDTSLTQGTSLPLSLAYEAFGDTQITVGFDTDANPYNNAGNTLHWSVSAPSSNGNIFSTTSASLSTAGLTAGDSYYVFAQITNGGETRYYYAPGHVTVTSATNQRPTAAVVTPSGAHSGSISVSYSLSDPESDTCGIKAQYSPDGGTTWYTATAGYGGDGAVGAYVFAGRDGPHVRLGQRRGHRRCGQRQRQNSHRAERCGRRGGRGHNRCLCCERLSGPAPVGLRDNPLGDTRRGHPHQLYPV